VNLVALAAFAASTLVPAQPTSFATVNLRMNIDSCEFTASTVRVSQQSNVIRVTHSPAACSPPGAPGVADVRLGAFPSGDYRVEVYVTHPGTSALVESLSFQVRDPVEIAIFPAPSRPLADYTGLWLDPRESGWGLSLYQGPTHMVFGLLFVYDGPNQPEWYSLQDGHWTSSTTWSANVYRTTGPAYFMGVFDPSQVSYAMAGTATLDFTQSPGQEGRARFTYMINGASVAKTIQRMPL
jgi:hypothetical protein